MADYSQIDADLAKMQNAGASKDEMRQYLELSTAEMKQPEAAPEVVPEITPEVAPEVPQYGTGRQVTQALTSAFGWGDEAKARIGAAYAKIVEPELLEDMSFEELVAKGEEAQRINQEQFAEESPWISGISEVAGAIPTALVPAAAATRFAPSAVAKLTQMYGGLGGKTRRAAQLAGMGGTGAVSGGIYAAGERGGTPEEREQAAREMGLVSGGAGLAFGAAAPYVVKGVGGLARRAKKAFGVGDEIAPPVGGEVRLPTGAKTGDVEMMRAEEAARQGLLGEEHQAIMQQIDKKFTQDVVGGTRAVAGAEGVADDLLESGISKVQRRFKAEKRVQSRLMTERNKAIANSKIYSDYTQETLGTTMKALKKTPDFAVNLGKSAMKPIKDEFKTLKKVVEGKDINAINFSFLQSWRSGLNNYRAGTQEGVLSGKMARVYDDWLDGITTQAIKEGDENLVDKIYKANRSYRGFATKYGTNKYKGQANVLERIVKQDELTPDQLVNMTFGKTLGGVSTTNQTVKRLMSAMPEGAKRETIKQDFKAGLIHRALERSYRGEKVSIATLGKNIDTLLKNRSFTENLASADDITTLKGVVSDINKYVAATTRRDVVSPSGGAVLRGLEGMLNSLGAVTGVVGGRVITEPARMMVREGKKAPERRLVEESLKQYGDVLSKTVKDRYKYYGSAIGGIAAADVLGEE